MASTSPALRGLRPLAHVEATCTGTGRSSGRPSWIVLRDGPHRQGRTRNSMMYGQGKSDSPIVPVKSPNNAARAAAEAMEGRGGAKGNAVRGSTCQTQSWESYPPHWIAYVNRIAYVKRHDGTSVFGSPHSFTM